MIKIISQILGVLGFLFFAFSIQMKDKKKILGMQLASNIFYTISYLLLGALAAVLIDIVSIFRCLIFTYYSDKKEKAPTYVVLVLISLSLLTLLFTFNDYFDILPVIISIIYILTTRSDSRVMIQNGFIMGAILWIIYNLHVESFTPLIGNVFEIISGIVAVIRFRKKIVKEKK